MEEVPVIPVYHYNQMRLVDPALRGLPSRNLKGAIATRISISASHEECGMKIAIISDLHGSLTALEQVLAQLAPHRGSLITICCSGSAQSWAAQSGAGGV